MQPTKSFPLKTYSSTTEYAPDSCIILRHSSGAYLVPFREEDSVIVRLTDALTPVDHERAFLVAHAVMFEDEDDRAEWSKRMSSHGDQPSAPGWLLVDAKTAVRAGVKPVPLGEPPAAPRWYICADDVDVMVWELTIGKPAAPSEPAKPTPPKPPTPKAAAPKGKGAKGKRGRQTRS